jgi:hypothetical protein
MLLLLLLLLFYVCSVGWEGLLLVCHSWNSHVHTVLISRNLLIKEFLEPEEAVVFLGRCSRLWIATICRLLLSLIIFVLKVLPRDTRSEKTVNTKL